MNMATTDTRSTEATLATLVARMEIESVQANFLHGLDDRDADRWLSAFHPDAVLDLEEAGLFTGPDEILDSAKAMWQLEQTTHLTGLAIIDLVDDEHATAVSRGIGMFALGDGTVAVKSVRISDRFSRRDGRWKLTHRKVSMISQISVDTGDDISRLDPASATA